MDHLRRTGGRVAVILLVLTATSCGPAPIEAPRASRSSGPAASVVPTIDPTISPTPSAATDGLAPPAWAFGLEAQLQCVGPAQGTGGELGDLGPGEGSGPTPEAALQVLLDSGFWATFPAGGFEAPFGTDHWARHEYLHEGLLRAVAVTTDVPDFAFDTGWAVVAIRACDPSEFDPADGYTFDVTLWRDASGALARSELISAIRGPGHCGWESSLWLRFEGELFLRDAEGVLSEYAVVETDLDVAMPADATPTGFETDQWQLFTVPRGDAVYVRTADGLVERWGRATDPFIGCA